MADTFQSGSTWRRLLPATLLLVGIAAGCTNRLLLIQAAAGTTVTRLNPEEGVEQKMGDVPVRLNNPTGVYVLKFDRKGNEPEYLVIPGAEEFRGKVTLSLSTSVSGGDYRRPRGPYIDSLLKAQRMILRGQTDAGRRLVEDLERQDGENFATIVLRANLAILEGNLATAAKLFKVAKDIYPESPEWTPQNSD